MTDRAIVIVSGLPRSGTSLMMQMLEAGGVPALTDNLRAADGDNPRGYYELEAVKSTGRNPSWLDAAEGKAVKMISMLLYDLPPARRYKVIFMTRNLDEILASQAGMLKNRGQPAGPDDAEMKRHYETHLRKVREWLATRPEMETAWFDYGDILADPDREAHRIESFLGRSLNIAAMAAAVDASLYRRRAATA